MTPNYFFIFIFLPNVVANPYIDHSEPFDQKFTIEDLLDFPEYLQQAYDKVFLSAVFPYDMSRLTIRKSQKEEETFQIIEFAP